MKFVRHITVQTTRVYRVEADSKELADQAQLDFVNSHAPTTIECQTGGHGKVEALQAPVTKITETSCL
jgi:hypothetical protein